MSPRSVPSKPARPASARRRRARIATAAALCLAAPIGPAAVGPALAQSTCIDFDGGPDGGNDFSGDELVLAANWVGDALPTGLDACVGVEVPAPDPVVVAGGGTLALNDLFSFSGVDVSNGRLDLADGGQIDGAVGAGPNIAVRGTGAVVLDGFTTVADGTGLVAVSGNGFLGGSGGIDDNLRNDGEFGPGPGVNGGVGTFGAGSFFQGIDGLTHIDIADNSDGFAESDLVVVDDAVDLDGTVRVDVAAGVDLEPLDEFTIVLRQPAARFTGLQQFDVDVVVTDNRGDVDFDPTVVFDSQTSSTALVLSVVDQPPPPDPGDPLTVSLADVEVEEGDDGTTEVELTATLNRPTTTDVDVEVEVTGVTGLAQIDFENDPAFARAPGFAQALGAIKIPAGDTAASLVLEVIGDGDPEPNETIEATILSVAPATVEIGQDTATVTILDDDEAPSLSDASLVPIAFDDTCLVDTDGLGLVKDEPLTTSQVASLLVTCSPPSAVDTVLIGRDDDFADSLASGFLQAQSPLLLVPGAGPIPADVVARLQQLAPRQVVILGGVDAVSPAVEQELMALGIAVVRRAGPTRIETAIEVAATDATDATTAIVARAFPVTDDPTQAFADAIAAGGMAADLGYPVLLTDPAGLSDATASYLSGSQITDVLVMGGTAAVSDLAAAQIAEIVPGTVTRVAGDSRAGTAIEVAKERGIESAADATDLIVVEGQTAFAWAGGLASAYLSAATGAPIVLLTDGEVPPETAAFLTPGATFAAQPGVQSVVCAAAGAGCLQARRVLGLDDATVTFDPPSLTPAVLGAPVAVAIPDLPEGASATYGGSCLLTTTDDDAEVVIRDDMGGPPLPCLVVVTITHPSGVVQTVTAAYTD